MTGLAALKAGIIIFIGLVAVVYGLAGQTELRAGLDGQSFCKATWPDGETWIWTRLGESQSALPFTVGPDDFSRCLVAGGALTNGSAYYIAHRGDSTDEAVKKLARSCTGDDAPCARIYDDEGTGVITRLTSMDGKTTVRPVWDGLSGAGINPLYDLLGRPFAALVTLLAVFSFGALAWRAWES